MNQSERLALHEALLANKAKLEAELRDIARNEAQLLAECTHTRSDGRSALTGGSTAKVCLYCGKIVIPKQVTLWG